MQGTKLMFGLGIAALAVGCTDTESTTDLNPVGPPMLRQVRMNHKVINSDGSESNKRVFAFGSHELAEADELQSNQVTSAAAATNSFRLVIDELLVGNNLEEIACRTAVDADAFQPVPVGATPDDIARCSVADDVLAASCGGPTAVCICQIDTGCLSAAGDAIAFGAPVGVLDFNQDGATDDTQFIAGSVGLLCGGGSPNPVNVPIDLEKSYWNPSGDQNRPAQGGFEALGPAIVLAPLGPLPTNLDCELVFSDAVVDKQGVKVCAPQDGNIENDCMPGDMSNFTFHTEVLQLKVASPSLAQPTVPKGTSVFTLTAAVPLKGTSVTTASNITLTAATGTQPVVAVTFDPLTPQIVLLTVTTGGTAGMTADTNYTLTITQNVTDTLDQPPPAPQVFTFKTGL